MAWAPDKLINKIRGIAGRAVAASLCAALAAIFAAAAIACSIAGVWIFALPYVGPAGAPLVVTGLLLVICLVLSAASWRVWSPKQEPPRPAMVPQLSIADAAVLFKNHKGAMLVAALLAGLIVGNDNRNR